MRLLVLALALAITTAACSKPAAPSKPAAAERNAAEDYARTIDGAVSCLRLSTNVLVVSNEGRPVGRVPDAALCDFGKVLAYCWAGVGAGSDCKPMVDFRPKKQEPVAAAPAPASSSPPPAPAPSSPPATPAKPEPPKAAPRK